MRREGGLPAVAFLMLIGCVAVPGMARANCYEDVGCTDTDRFPASELMRLAGCDILWEMRNGIYKENGYCFRTPKSIETFGNAGCRYDDAEAVPLNAFERDNVATIKSVEQGKGCRE